MALHEMKEAHDNMVQGGRKPALWLLSSATLQQLLRETKRRRLDELLGVQVREMPRWSFGWELVDAVARHRGYPDS